MVFWKGKERIGFSVEKDRVIAHTGLVEQRLQLWPYLAVPALIFFAGTPVLPSF